jgi:hypothetical protein
MDVLSNVGAVHGGKPFEPFGKDSICSEGGSTGRRTDWPCHINIAKKGEIAETVRSAPGRDPRMARVIRIFRVMARKSMARKSEPVWEPHRREPAAA